MTVYDVLTKWLKENGYDGLVSNGAECGCEIGNLASCDESFGTCCPAYRGADPTGECDWLMYQNKEAAKASRRREE
jgi:hypothetical protein